MKGRGWDVAVRVIVVIRCERCRRKLGEILYGDRRPMIKCQRCKTLN